MKTETTKMIKHKKSGGETSTWREHRPLLRQIWSESKVLGSGVQSQMTEKFNDISGKIFVNIQSVFTEIRAKVWKNAVACSIEESFKQFLDPDPEADDYQNFNKFFLMHRYISDKILYCSVMHLKPVTEDNVAYSESTRFLFF